MPLFSFFNDKFSVSHFSFEIENNKGIDNVKGTTERYGKVFVGRGVKWEDFAVFVPK